MKTRQNKMMSYLAVTAGVGCVSSVANAAVVFYGNAGNNNLIADPTGFDVGFYISVGRNRAIVPGFGAGPAVFNVSSVGYFTRGADLGVSTGTGNRGAYRGHGSFYRGAVAGAQNYANISFDGFDGVYEAVAQFFFNGSGGGYLMAITTTNAISNPQNLSAVGGPALSISEGKTIIDAAGGVNNFSGAVPEPSSLGLLALGATGLLARRRRKQAA
jgi:hypothetical protein